MRNCVSIRNIANHFNVGQQIGWKVAIGDIHETFVNFADPIVKSHIFHVGCKYVFQ